MSTIRLDRAYPSLETSVSNKFIDEYMTDANGEFVKVYLYLLRCLSGHKTDCSISAMADRFNHTEADIIRAIKYWERQGLLDVSYNENQTIKGIHFADLHKNANDEENNEEITLNNAEITSDSKSSNINLSSMEPSSTIVNTSSSDVSVTNASSVANAVEKETPKKKNYTLDEKKVFQQNPEIQELLFVMESLTRHPLSSSDCDHVFFWYDVLKFDAELIEYLVEYCITKGHSSIRYMEKVALGWHEEGIDTVEKAKETSAIRSKAYYRVMKAFGISGRNLVANENAFLEKWTKEYLFDIEIVEEACNRTMSAISKPSFEYADTILTNWHKNHVHTLKDIEVLDQSYAKTKKIKIDTVVKPARNKFNNFSQRNYDYDELEKVLLTTQIQ